MLEGAFELIDEGWYQGNIADAAYDFEKKINLADGLWLESTTH